MQPARAKAIQQNPKVKWTAKTPDQLIEEGSQKKQSASHVQQKEDSKEEIEAIKTSEEVKSTNIKEEEKEPTKSTNKN